MFTKFREYKHIYAVSIGICTAVGLSLIFYSSPLFMALAGITGWGLFEGIYANNYLFIRLGDVFISFFGLYAASSSANRQDHIKDRSEYAFHLCDSLYRAVWKLYGSGALSFLPSQP